MGLFYLVHRSLGCIAYLAKSVIVQTEGISLMEFESFVITKILPKRVFKSRKLRIYEPLADWQPARVKLVFMCKKS
jgi:hypothetical protein